VGASAAAMGFSVLSAPLGACIVSEAAVGLA